MNSYFIKILLTVVSYFTGAIPFGLIISMFMGAGDIRKMGSGNIGATNVLRTTGKLGGAITLLLDALKGFIPVLIARQLWGIDSWTLVIAFAAVIGHNFPVYLKFKGGKGVATSYGVLFALWPYAGFITLGIWIISLVLWKYSSLGALISFALMPIVVVLGEKSILYLIFTILISSMIYIRHIENIKRLISGEEKRISKNKIKNNNTTTTLLFLIFILIATNVFAGVQSSKTTHTQSLPLLIREGYINIDKGQAEEAYRIGVSAKELSPDYAPAYFLTAKSLRKMSKFAPAFSEYIDGIKVSFKDFRTLYNITGTVFLFLTITILFTSFSILLAWMIRILPVFYHTFRETTSNYIEGYLRPLFLGFVVVFPAVLGIGWFVIFWIICLWIYLNKRERITAVLILIFLLSLPILLKYNAGYLNNHNNITLQGLIAADNGIGDTTLIMKLKEQYAAMPDNTYLPLSIAALISKEGDINGAIEYYRKILVSDNEGVKTTALNNIGNLYFESGDHDKAIEYYKAAAKETSISAIPSYNLSLAYREKLMFEEADKAYNTARGINLKDTEKFSGISSKGGSSVVDYPISKSDLWSVALRPTEESKMWEQDVLHGIFRISGDRFPFLGVSLLIFITVLSYVKPRTPMAYYCPECRRIVCGLCKGSRVFGSICMECRKKGEKEEITETGLDKRFSFLLPGIWHIYRGNTFFGIIVNLIFFMGLLCFLSGNLYDIRFSAYIIPHKIYLVGLFLIIVSYVMIFLNFKYIRMRFK
ncbi:MAG: glycerol-3-phosphate 1-O-acyltransferase PlsY [Nitrospirae bacterium]|nr:glycerol-3-phosphate 1-O-acyltransferase PlsY [Nitrospirota bacterium]